MHCFNIKTAASFFVPLIIGFFVFSEIKGEHLAPQPKESDSESVFTQGKIDQDKEPATKQQEALNFNSNLSLQDKTVENPGLLEEKEAEVFRLSVLADPIGILPASPKTQEDIRKFSISISEFKPLEYWKILNWEEFYLESGLFEKPIKDIMNSSLITGTNSNIATLFAELISEVEQVKTDSMLCSDLSCLFEIRSGYSVSTEKTGVIDSVTGKEKVHYHHEMLDVFPNKCEPLATNGALSQEDLKVLVVCSELFQ